MATYPDHFGKDAGELRDKKLWLFDMDGTIYEENDIFDGTLDLLDTIEVQGGRYIFVTNNSSKSVDDYVAKVHKMGIRATTDTFYTSVNATVRHLDINHPGALVYVQGTESLVQQLRDADIRVTTEVDPAVDVVLIGFDTELTMEKLRRTCKNLLRDSVVYLATNPDLVCPTSWGFEPDCGSMAYGIYNATGRKPFVIGKPEPVMVDCVREQLGYSAAETVLVGDRLYTDIATGVNAGVSTICVLTGEATLDDIAASEVKPTYVIDGVRQINDLLLAD